jgi:hypothetical protein
VKGTGLSPYIKLHNKGWALAPEAIFCARLRSPQRLKQILFEC